MEEVRIVLLVFRRWTVLTQTCLYTFKVQKVYKDPTEIIRLSIIQSNKSCEEETLLPHTFVCPHSLETRKRTRTVLLPNWHRGWKGAVDGSHFQSHDPHQLAQSRYGLWMTINNRYIHILSMYFCHLSLRVDSLASSAVLIYCSLPIDQQTHRVLIANLLFLMHLVIQKFRCLLLFLFKRQLFLEMLLLLNHQILFPLSSLNFFLSLFIQFVSLFLFKCIVVVKLKILSLFLSFFIKFLLLFLPLQIKALAHFREKFVF